MENTKWDLGAAEKQDWSVGQILEAKRKQRNFSIQYVCEQLHFRADLLLALEADDFERLPEPPFIRGYIRSYAKLLDVEPEVLLKKLEAALPQKPASRPRLKKKKKVRTDKALIWSTTSVIVLLSVLFATWWLYPQQNESFVQVDDAVETALNEAKSVFPADEVEAVDASSSSVALTDATLNLPEAVSGQAELNAVSSYKEDDQETSVTAPVGAANVVSAGLIGDEQDLLAGEDLDRVTIQYVEESWTVVTDAKDNELLHGLYKPGAVRKLQGEAPFNIFLGNSPGVVISINGKPFDQSRFNRRNRTARFELTDSNS